MQWSEKNANRQRIAVFQKAFTPWTKKTSTRYRPWVEKHVVFGRELRSTERFVLSGRSEARPSKVGPIDPPSGAHFYCRALTSSPSSLEHYFREYSTVWPYLPKTTSKSISKTFGLCYPPTSCQADIFSECGSRSKASRGGRDARRRFWCRCWSARENYGQQPEVGVFEFWKKFVDWTKWSKIGV